MDKKFEIDIYYTLNQFLEKINNSINNFQFQSNLNDIIQFLINCYETQTRIFVIGNGGSAANASHFAQDLVKGTFPQYYGLRDSIKMTFNAISLCDNTSFITAVANDDGYENIYYEQLKALSQASDVLIVISGSGNSDNVVKAAHYCRRRDIKVISFTGFDGGKIKELSDLNLNVAIDDMMVVESVHSIIFHYIINKLKQYRASR